MGLFSRRGAAWNLSGVEERSLPVRDSHTLLAGPAHWPYSPYSSPSRAPLTPEASLCLADVLACVRVLAGAASTLPLNAYRRGAGGARVPDTGPLAALLQRPSATQTPSSFISTVVAHLALTGNAYVGLYRPASGGAVAQLVPLDPAIVVPSLEYGVPRFTLTSPAGTSVHGADEVIHIRGLSLDGLVGLSPIRLARESLAHASALAAHSTAFAQNGARVGAVLSAPGVEGPDTLERLEAKWESRAGSPTQSGAVVMVAGDVKYHPLGLTMADADWIATRQLSSQEVCRVFGVHPAKIGVSAGDSLTYSTQESADIDFAKYALGPHLAAIEQALSLSEALSPGDTFCEFDLVRLLRGDSAARTAYYAGALGGGWMTPNEIRAAENLPPLPGGDKLPHVAAGGPQISSPAIAPPAPPNLPLEPSP